MFVFAQPSFEARNILGRAPTVAQRTLYRERIWLISLTTSNSSCFGLLVGNLDTRSRSALACWAPRLVGSTGQRTDVMEPGEHTLEQQPDRWRRNISTITRNLHRTQSLPTSQSPWRHRADGPLRIPRACLALTPGHSQRRRNWAERMNTMTRDNGGVNYLRSA